MHSGLWIWIRINFPSWILINIQHADPDPVGKIEQKRKKKTEKCKEIGTGKNCTSIKKFEVNLHLDVFTAAAAADLKDNYFYTSPICPGMNPTCCCLFKIPQYM